MNFLRRSKERMRPTRSIRSRSVLRGSALPGWIALLAGATLVGNGCKDDLAAPTLGRLEISLTNEVADAFVGGEITISHSGEVETVVADTDFFDLTFEGGTEVTVRFEKACTAVTPSASQVVMIEAGGTSTVNWSINVPGGLTVRSNPIGASIWLDGEDTGRVTPTTLECQELGDHEITLKLVGTLEASRSLEVTSAGAEISIDLDIIEQTRGALVEVLTATECPNCLPVDLAAENIWLEQDLVAKRAITLQVHHPWAQGVDVFHTQDTWDRNAFYDAGDGSAGHPIRLINGTDRLQGAGDGNVKRLTNTIRDEINVYVDQPGQFAMHWTETNRVEGKQVSATVRVFATSDVADAANTSILAMNYKHELVTFVRIHRIDEEFYRVVRNIDNAGSCADLGLFERGDFVDLEFVFDTSWDTEWHEDGMGMVALVQNLSTREVLQVTHTFLP